MRRPRKTTRHTEVVTHAITPTVAGPLAPQCPACKAITARTENSILNQRYDQFFDCQCGQRVTVPAIQGANEWDQD